MSFPSNPIHRSAATPSSPSNLHPHLQRLSTFKERNSTVVVVDPPTPSSSTPSISPSSTTSILDFFSSDPIFSTFLSPSFDSSFFSSNALSSGSSAARAEKLQQGLRLLRKQLRADVLSKNDDLISQISSLSHADSALSTLRSGVSSLQSSLLRLRSEISDPHRSIRIKTLQFDNLHTTIEHLQSVIRVLRLCKRLRDVMSVSHESEKMDFSKAAQLHSEILKSCQENELSGIDLIDVELKWVLESGERVRIEVMDCLERGMEGLNQAEVGTALQVFYNLGELGATVDGLMNKYKDLGVKCVTVALDMRTVSSSLGTGFGPQRSGTPQIGGSSKASESLWQRMSTCMDEIHSIVISVWHLQRVLSKKRDPFTHLLLLDNVVQEGGVMLTDGVWEAIVGSFAKQMKSSFTTSSFVKEVFTLGYPKLFSMVENHLDRISRDTDVKGVIHALSPEAKNKMISAIEIFQTAFLGLCLGRLSDLVNSVFPLSNRGNVPSKEQVSKIISRIQEEIEAVQMNETLTVLILREINKVLLLIAERAEYQISTGVDARQVTGAVTTAQARNMTISQHLHTIHTETSSHLKTLKPHHLQLLSPSLSSLDRLSSTPLSLIFHSLLLLIDSTLLGIHSPTPSGPHYPTNRGPHQASSPYMEELHSHLLHFHTTFLSSSSVSGLAAPLLRSAAERTLVLFLRHASLVRPLSESGKLGLARDMAELEMTVGQNLFPVEQVGPAYRALRAFRPILFMQLSELKGSPLVRDVPASVVLHHLYSRAPPEMESPLERGRLTPAQYSLWLDAHTEAEIWRGVKATVEEYVGRVRARGQQESEVCRVMLDLGSSLVSD